jgi:hypothetical protein
VIVDDEGDDVLGAEREVGGSDDRAAPSVWIWRISTSQRADAASAP